MALSFLSGLIILTGTVCLFGATVVAVSRLRSARKIYQRLLSHAAFRSTGWGEWFFGGFSAFLGARFMGCVFIFVIGMMSGIGFIGLGLKLLR